MDTQRWKQIDAVFEQMLEIEPGERADALARMCAGDDELRRRVEELLEQEEPAEDFLKSSAIAGLAEQVVGELSALAPGQQIGQYRIKERIGAGGMSEVWRAWDQKLERDVAIKVLPPEFSADADRVQRFEREARTISRLKHSNIITIYDIVNVADESGDLHLIVTELVEGQTLRERLGTRASSAQRAGSARNRIGWREAVLVATQIADALNAVHVVEIIHRDIKPENVMIQAGGRVKLLDFGIAKWGSGAAAGGGAQPVAGIQTRLGVTPGTLRYMSPEQARNEHLDVRTEVFSLGLMFYEMIAGQHPYDGKSDEEIIEALKSDDEIPPVAEAPADIPAAPDRIVAKALRKRRDERYASGGEMLADLERLRSLVEVGGGEEVEERLRAESADQLLTQFVVFHDADPKTRIPLSTQWTIRRFADLKRGKLERELMWKSLVSGLTKAALWVLLVAAVTMVVAAWMSVNETWDERILRDGHTAAVRRAAFSPDGRLLVSVGEDKQVIVWNFARRERLATFSDHTDQVTTVEFSPDGKWFVTASADGSVIVWDAVRLAKTTVLPGQRGVVRAIAISGDGRVLITPTNDDRKNIWGVGSWKKLREVKMAGYRYGQFLSSPDGRWLMAPHGDILDLVQGRVIDDKRPYFWGGITPYSADTRPPFWSWAARSPDGRHIISIDAGGFVAFTETDQFEAPERRKLTGHFRAHTDSGRAVAFSPDGKLAASGAEDIVLWDALAQKKLARLKHPASVASLAFSPKGNYLVSTHADGSILTWDTVEHELVADFGEHHTSVEAVAFAPTGKQVATAGEDRSIIVWNVERGQKEAVLLWHPIRITALAFSNDGQWLASNDLDGNLALWEVGARQLRWSFTASKRIPSEASYCVAVSPDGKWVANSYGIYETGVGRLAYDFRAEIPLTHLGFPQPTELRSLAFSGDGRWLVSVTARGDIAIRRSGEWRVTESQKLNDTHPVSVSLSPDGSQLATGEDEGSVRLWQTQPLGHTAVIGKHDARVKSVALSPDGREVVSASDDKTICLWDVGGRKLVTRIGTHTSPVLAIAFSPDGKQIVSGERDHSVRLYTRRRGLWGIRLD